MTPTLIMTRPAPQGEAFAQQVLDQWNGPLQVIQSPLLEIIPLAVAANLDRISGVVFTSANGVAASSRLHLPQGLTAWCVGERTAELARDAGFEVITGPGDAAGLLSLLVKQAPAGPLAHIRGRHARGDICAQLTDANIACIDVVAYDQVALPLNAAARHALGGKDPVILPLFSPRTADLLKSEAPFDAPLHLVLMSDAVRSAADGLASASFSVAARPDAASMVRATVKTLKNLTQGRN